MEEFKVFPFLRPETNFFKSQLCSYKLKKKTIKNMKKYEKF